MVFIFVKWQHPPTPHPVRGGGGMVKKQYELKRLKMTWNAFLDHVFHFCQMTLPSPPLPLVDPLVQLSLTLKQAILFYLFIKLLLIF